MFKKILVPVDLSIETDAQKLLSATKDMSAGWNAEIHVVTVIPNVGMAIVGGYFDKSFEDRSRAAASEQLTAAIAEAGLNAQPHVLAGSVYDRVISLAAKIDADLIIVGAHQPKLKDYLLGANAAKIVRHSHQSVLVLRDAT